MAVAKVNDLIDCYPLDLVHMSESNTEERDFNVTGKEFLYETSKINFDSWIISNNIWGNILKILVIVWMIT